MYQPFFFFFNMNRSVIKWNKWNGSGFSQLDFHLKIQQFDTIGLLLLFFFYIGLSTIIKGQSLIRHRL